MKDKIQMKYTLLLMLCATPVVAYDHCPCLCLWEKIKALEGKIEKLESDKIERSDYIYFSTKSITDKLYFYEDNSINDGAYTCAKCGRTFKRKNLKTSCAVMHPPGDCCHYGEDIENIEKINKEIQ